MLQNKNEHDSYLVHIINMKILNINDEINNINLIFYSNFKSRQILTNFK